MPYIGTMFNKKTLASLQHDLTSHDFEARFKSASKNEHGWPFKSMHILTGQFCSQSTDLLRLPQGHRTGIVRFVQGGREDNTMTARQPCSRRTMSARSL